jgi:hypothetical protein
MLYSPQQLGINASTTGGVFKDLAWYGGRQYSAKSGTLGEVNQIHPESPQAGSGQQVSAEVRGQSAAKQGVTTQQFDNYLTQQNGGAPVTPGNNPEEFGFGGGGGGLGGGQPTLDLQSTYDKLYKTPEIQTANQAIIDKQAEIEKVKKAAADEVAKINDNPYLSEATRVGKIDKLQNKANADINNLSGEMGNLQNNLNTLRSNAETQLNLNLKQYDINHQAMQDSLSRLNALVSMGALSSASSSDIAQLSAQTGVSTAMLQGVIQKAKTADIAPYITTATDNNGNLTIVAVDKNTGTIINTQSVGGVGKSKTGGDTTVSSSKNILQEFNSTASSAKGQTINGTYWGIFPQLVAQYAPTMSLESIYKNYANTSLGKKYGTPKESAQQIKELYSYAKSGTVPKTAQKKL